MEWQPIETAPKDKTKILLVCPTRDGSQLVWISTGNRFRRGRRGELGIATHWMPLPVPPSAEGEAR
jgi:hypothetical protein